MATDDGSVLLLCKRSNAFFVQFSQIPSHSDDVVVRHD